MKSLVFDTGPIISLAMNNLVWLLEPLKNQFDGAFYITPGVYKELIEVPLTTKKFKFEALQILKYINKGVIEVVEDSMIHNDTRKLIDLANKVFKSRGNWIKLVHYAEIETIAAALELGSEAMVIDERTTRSLVESPDRLKKTLERRLHAKITVDESNLNEFNKLTKGIKFIRSTEMAVMAYELGLLDNYIPEKITHPKKQLIESMLWAIKLNGCAISGEEIDAIVKEEISE